MRFHAPTGIHARSIRQSTRRLNVWTGAVSAGKTITSLVAWAHFLATGPPGPTLMVGKTERTLARNVLDPLAEILGPTQVRVTVGSGEASILGRRVYLAGANDERAEQKIRGLSLVGAYGDELTLWPESFFRMLLSRLRLPGARLYGTTNPDHPRHWLKTGWLDRADELDLAHFHLTIDDNPTLDPAYVDAVKTEYVGLWHDRFIRGLWVAGEGRVYDAFNPGDGRIVTGELPDRIDRAWIAVDYGTSNPFVALLLAIGPDRRLWVLDEWRWDSRSERRQLTDAEYGARLRAWVELELPDRIGWRPDVVAVVYDPSAASFGQQLRRDGWPAVIPGDNAVADGIRDVARLMAPAVDRLRISSSCTGLIDELAGYVWDTKAVDEDRPVKDADHGPDALRYGVRHVLSAPARRRSSSWT